MIRWILVQASRVVSLLTVIGVCRAGVVTSTGDSGPGSLRGEIAAAAPGDTITFDSSLAGATITLTGGELTIDKDLVIEASALADPLAVDANGAITNHRVLRITSGATVVLEGLTLTGGKPLTDDDYVGGGA
ncbi:MAG: hypothetical protein GWO24_26825, partial [Akkermansiaceae bacterium]|nr:hypothetical protein [Akkermansiaceae bacterium]